jgi:hypothetical protein
MTDDTFIYISDGHIIQLSNIARNKKGITAEHRRNEDLLSADLYMHKTIKVKKRRRKVSIT